MKTFLHVGCGLAQKQHTTGAFAGADWREVRLDIDKAVNPDIVGTITDMKAVRDESVDAIFSSHNIEHLYAHEVPRALAEFLRVLKPDGFAIITCPDLKSVATLIVADKLTDMAYMSAAGPIAPLDILYGHRPQLAKGNVFMAHHSGFTEKTLNEALAHAGFGMTASGSRGAPVFDIWAVACKNMTSPEKITQLARQHFPNANF
jgi:ubiquinone/menaquinone biosynthesis C-methylase UbiE